MKVLVINCGSSSLKYQLIDMKNENVLAKGLVERIGIEDSILNHSANGSETKTIKDIKDHKEAAEFMFDSLLKGDLAVIDSIDEIKAIGHRVTHGGEKYTKSILIDDEVINTIKECIKLAPLHNPAQLSGINITRELCKDIPMVAVFDTAFHQTMKKEAYIYPVPYELYEEDAIRKYGFHGISVNFVITPASRLLNQDLKNLKLVICHLGSGASISAVKDGVSVENSMGLTPLEGIPMGTRCGSIDPSIPEILSNLKNITMKEVNDILNKKSGLLGMSKRSNDLRDILKGIEEGDEYSKTAFDVFVYRIAMTICSYMPALEGIDGIIFTAGMGENSKELREAVCKKLEFLGVSLDDEKNSLRGKEIIISDKKSKIKVMVIPTNEELMIARDALSLVK